MVAGKLLNILSYIVSIMLNDCPECGRNGDLCICEAPEYEDYPEREEDRLLFCYTCERYDCICGEYDDVIDADTDSDTDTDTDNIV